jgi:hypothetical protein
MATHELQAVSERQVTSPIGLAAVIKFTIDGGSPANNRNETVPFGAPSRLAARVYWDSSSERVPLLALLVAMGWKPNEAEYAEFGAEGSKYLFFRLGARRRKHAVRSIKKDIWKQRYTARLCNKKEAQGVTDMARKLGC